jgi:hypothetical protein
MFGTTDAWLEKTTLGDQEIRAIIHRWRVLAFMELITNQTFNSVNFASFSAYQCSGNQVGFLPDLQKISPTGIQSADSQSGVRAWLDRQAEPLDPPEFLSTEGPWLLAFWTHTSP